jgi:NAD(P)-dependent dehydrogenase (short-subunit alcohol dehydrogenase family)
MTTALVFGATGGIGAPIAEALAADHDTVLRASRRGDEGLVHADPPHLEALDALPALDAVVWAQGANVNDSAADVDVGRFEEVMAANVTYVVATLQRLLRHDRIADGARLVVVSSIWETVARPGKFSYTVSKAAIGGLVRAASADLAQRGILVNAVLPGVTDTAMTRAMLSDAQVDAVASQTGFGRLTSTDDVAGLVAHLCSARNTGVTGQSVAVDLGFSHVRQL